MLTFPYNSTNNFHNNYNISDHWEVKCWWLHLEIHLQNHIVKKGVWRLNIEEVEVFLESLVQEEEVIQGFI